MNGTLNFAVVGTGRMASAMMAALVLKRDVKVTSVCSSSAERAGQFARRFGIAQSYGNLQALLSDDAIHAVYIANRNADHAAVAIAALNAGKAVLCEKPFALSAAQGETVIAAAKSAGKLFMEAMWTPFLPAYERLHSLANSGNLGKPTHLSFSFGYPTHAHSYPQLFAPMGGGVLLDRAVYGIALAHRLFGDVAQVDSVLERNDDGVDVHASLQLAHRNGGQSQLGFSLTSLLSNTASVACERGMVGLAAPAIGAETVVLQRQNEIRADGTEAGSAAGMKQRVTDRIRGLPLARRIKSRLSGPKVEFHSFGPDPYLAQLSHFIQLLRDDRLESDVNTLTASLAILEVVDAAKVVRRG